MAVWFARTQTVGDLMGSNVISCLFGALSGRLYPLQKFVNWTDLDRGVEILVQVTVADVFFVHERGFMNSLYFWVAQLR